jgi:hypothetical protein
LSSIIEKETYLNLFTDFTVPNNSRSTPLSVAQQHLPVFLIIALVHLSLSTRQVDGIAQLLNEIIHNYSSLLQYNIDKGINTVIDIGGITDKCKKMFVVNWSHFVIAVAAGIIPNLTELIEEYPKTGELLPTMFAIWCSHRPPVQNGIITVPTTFSFSLFEIIIPLITSHPQLQRLSSDGSFMDAFLATVQLVMMENEHILAKNNNHSNGGYSYPQPQIQPKLPTALPKETANLVYETLVKIEHNFNGIQRVILIQQFDAMSSVIYSAFSRSQRLFFYQQNNDHSTSIPKFPHASPYLPQRAINYAFCQFLITFCIVLFVPQDSPRRIQDTANIAELESLLNKMLYANAFNSAFVSKDCFVVKMYENFKIIDPKNPKIALDAKFEQFFEFIQSTNLTIPISGLLSMFLAKQLPIRLLPGSKPYNYTEAINAVVKFARLLVDAKAF